MKKKIFTWILAVGVFAVAISCKNEADPEADKSAFTRFYDNSNFNVAYTPLDVVQTTDGGYIVLALKRTIISDGSDVDPGVIYLMKTDAFGAFVSDTELDADLNIPTQQLLKINDKFYFFCMSVGSTGVQLMEVGQDGQVAQQFNVGVSYPACSCCRWHYVAHVAELRPGQSYDGDVDRVDFGRHSEDQAVHDRTVGWTSVARELDHGPHTTDR